ncbi:MAG: von Willebrand factor type A domain-containing protein [Chromatiales bacterium]|nr:von Willebrand factor type A domain-containing protein [Chromatiales bacterium]
MNMKCGASLAALAILGVLLGSCTTGNPGIAPRVEPEVKTTGATKPAAPAQTSEQDARDAVAKHKLEDRYRLTESLPRRAAPATAGVVPYEMRLPSEPTDRENYGHFDDHPVKRVAEAPVSTFSIDVDTGAYSNVRRLLNQGQLPVKDAVRVEEMINYFSYDYPLPADKTRPFSVTTEIAPTPWNKDSHLLRIGLKGYEVAAATSCRPANLVFLVDVSGSMMSPDKLPLLKSGAAAAGAASCAPRTGSPSLVVYAGAHRRGAGADRRATRRRRSSPRSTASAPAVRPTAAPASASPTTWPSRASSGTASTACCSPPTATSTSAP